MADQTREGKKMEWITRLDNIRTEENKARQNGRVGKESEKKRMLDKTRPCRSE